MQRQPGCVKWFNNKTGYGFIRNLESEEDIFVHHTALNTVLSYRYLVQGEYVEYDKGVHVKTGRTVAVNVTGIKKGKLMCETRAENQPARDMQQMDAVYTMDGPAPAVVAAAEAPPAEAPPAESAPTE
jgi:CspA family cold shock protein